MRFKDKNIYYTIFYLNNNTLTECVEIISEIEKIKLRLFIKTGEKIYLKCF